MACNCNITLSNTGVAGCKTIMSVGKKLILVPRIADDGTFNKIDLANDSIDAQYFIDKVNEVDPSKRWYPMPLIDNVEDVKADPIVEGLNSGQNIIVQDGVRTFTGVLVNQTTKLLSKLLSFKCASFGVYIVDKEGQLIGSEVGTDLYPILVDNNTLDIRLVKSTDTTVQKLMVKFEFAQTENDSYLSLISASETGTNLLLLDGLLDVNLTATSPTQTSVVVTAKLDYGTALNKLPQKGLVKADFSLYNVTDGAPVSVATATETSDGVYTLTYTSQTANDVIRVSGSKEGLEFVSTTFTVAS